MGGATVPALRNWLRGVREGVYQLVTEVVEHVPATFASSKVAEQLVAMMLGAVGDLEERHLRLLLRHVALPVMRRCPRPLRPRWLGPMLGGFLPGMERRVRDMWARLMPYLDGEAAAVAKGACRAIADVLLHLLVVRVLMCVLIAYVVPCALLVHTELSYSIPLPITIEYRVSYFQVSHLVLLPLASLTSLQRERRRQRTRW